MPNYGIFCFGLTFGDVNWLSHTVSSEDNGSLMFEPRSSNKLHHISWAEDSGSFLHSRTTNHRWKRTEATNHRWKRAEATNHRWKRAEATNRRWKRAEAINPRWKRTEANNPRWKRIQPAKKGWTIIQPNNHRLTIALSTVLLSWGSIWLVMRLWWGVWKSVFILNPCIRTGSSALVCLVWILIAIDFYVIRVYIYCFRIHVVIGNNVAVGL